MRRFVSARKVREALDIPRSTLARLVAEGSFPQPYAFGSRSIYFDADEIDAFIASRKGLKARGVPKKKSPGGSPGSVGNGERDANTA